MTSDIQSARALSDLIKDDLKTISDKTLTLGEILILFHERGIGFVLFIFALPMALPLPVPPGVNILLATPLILLTGQQALGLHTLWLPHRFKQKKINAAQFKQTVLKTLPYIQKFEHLIKPRLAWVTHGFSAHIIGISGLIMALCVCIPVPLTNTVPSLGIALMAIGVVMRDGLSVLTGMFIGLSWVVILIVTFFLFGHEAADIIKGFIR